MELVHNFSLLHDDIMDGDTERRHRPTAWTVFGVGAAILAGDALLALANDLLLEDMAPGGPWAARCLSTAVQRLIAGQGEDLAFEKRGDVTLDECLEMAGDKTAALMACACTIGAVHVGAPPEMAMGLAEFGGHVGLAFQLTDDLLGIWGAPEVTGKPVRADLRARKKSLPVVAALSSGTPAATELAGILASEAELTEEDLIHAADLVVAAGGKAVGRAGGRRPAGRRRGEPGRRRHPGRRPGRVHRRSPSSSPRGSGSPMASLAGRAPTRGTEARARGAHGGPNAASPNAVDGPSTALDGGRWTIDHPWRRPGGRGRHARARPRPPPGPPGPQRLLDRRARDERHDGRRGRPAAPLSRHPHRSRPQGDGGLDSLAAAR